MGYCYSLDKNIREDMKKSCLFFIVFVVVALSACKRTVASNNESGNTHESDSIAEVASKDSIERERIFAAKGDTIFGKMLYGINKSEAIKEAKEFVTSLSKGQGVGFYFDTFSFLPIEYFYEIEKMSASGLKYFSSHNRLYKNKLYSVGWESFVNYGKSGSEIAERIDHLVKLFEIKYGKCSKNNYNLCGNFGQYIGTNRIYVEGTVAEWRTNERAITFYINELFGSDRRSESSTEPYQYKLSIQFVDRAVESEAEQYIDEVLNAHKKAKRSQEVEDSINMMNAL